MKLGIVGTGMIAQIVGPNLPTWGFPVEAVAGTPETIDEARDLAVRCGAAVALPTYDELLQMHDVDTVYLAVPNALHHPFGMQALEAGKHVIIEKPLSSNAREAEELSNAARERGLLLFEAIATPYLPNYLRIRELLPHIGTVKLVSANYSQYSSRYDAFRSGATLPAFDPEKSGGALMDLGLYTFHWIMDLFGEPDVISYRANIERGIDTSGIALLTYPTFQAVALAAKDCSAPAANVIEGTEGFILQESPANQCTEVVLRLNDGTEESYRDNPAMPWESEFRAYAQMIATSDHERCYAMLDRSLAVARAMTQARLDAGVIFPADKL